MAQRRAPTPDQYDMILASFTERLESTRWKYTCHGMPPNIRSSAESAQIPASFAAMLPSHALVFSVMSPTASLAPTKGMQMNRQTNMITSCTTSVYATEYIPPMKASTHENTALTRMATTALTPRSTERQAPSVERAMAIQKTSPRQAGRYSRATIHFLNFSEKGSNMVR